MKKLLLLLLICLSNYSFAQSKIDSLLKIYIPDNRTGYSVAVSQNKKLVYYKNSGYANLEHKIPVDPHTLFAIASVTKAFTEVALLKLYSEGKVNLNSDVQKYVPQFPVKKKKKIKLTNKSVEF